MSRSEARRAIGLPGRPDTDPMFQPVNIETVDQAQARKTAPMHRPRLAAAANSSVSASLVRQLDGLRPLAVDVAACQLESAGVVSREEGRET